MSATIEGLNEARERERDTLLERLLSIRHLLLDPTVTDISLTEPLPGAEMGQVWADYDRVGYRETGVFLSSQQAELVVNAIAMHTPNAEFSQRHPRLKCQALGGEYRLEAQRPPATRKAVVWTLRKYVKRSVRLQDYVDAGELSPVDSDLLLDAARCGESILLAGATGVGKTTLTNAILLELGQNQSTRILTIEDTPELERPNELSLQLVVQEDGSYTYEQAVRDALRHKPSYIVLGELRSGEEANEALSAWDSGHAGLATIHAGSIERMPQRLLSLCRRADRGRMVTPEEIADLVGVLVHVRRVSGRRMFTVRRLGWDGTKFTFGRLADGDEE